MEGDKQARSGRMQMPRGAMGGGDRGESMPGMMGGEGGHVPGGVPGGRGPVGMMGGEGGYVPGGVPGGRVGGEMPAGMMGGDVMPSELLEAAREAGDIVDVPGSQSGELLFDISINV